MSGAVFDAFDWMNFCVSISYVGVLASKFLTFANDFH